MDNILKNINEYHTPCYLLDKERLIFNCEKIRKAFQKKWKADNLIFGYSIKTNNRPQFLEIVRELGWYAEAVSDFEIEMAKNCGYTYKNIIYNGTCRKHMLFDALSGGAIVNLDSMEEVKSVSMYRGAAKVGLRVNFDLEKACPGETTAGLRASRFGISYENRDLEKAICLLRNSKKEIAGLHFHMSTTTRSTHVFKEIAKMAVHVIKEYHLNLDYIDIGGGFFGGKVVPEKPKMEDYAETICNTLKIAVDENKTKLILEPGVSVVATAVTYLSSVTAVKDIRENRIVVLDGTALHINPFLQNRFQPYRVYSGNKEKIKEQLITGSTCMEKDYFVNMENEIMLSMGDKVEFFDAGAYTGVFNSSFILDTPRLYVI